MERCRFPETAVAIAYETQGLFELAQESYEKVYLHTCLYTQANPHNIGDFSHQALSVTAKAIATEVPCIGSSKVYSFDCN